MNPIWWVEISVTKLHIKNFHSNTLAWNMEPKEKHSKYLYFVTIVTN